MTSIQDSFDRAFRDKSTANTISHANDSDSDSAKEQEKIVQEKRLKKGAVPMEDRKLLKINAWFLHLKFAMSFRRKR